MKKNKDVTIYDIAEKLNIATSTVSRALQNHHLVKPATKEKILQTAEKLGYRYNNIAGNLGKKKSNTIGVIVHELNSHFITSVLAGIEKKTSEAGYNILITHSSESVEREKLHVQNLIQNRVAGVIASLSFETKSLEHFSIFDDKKIPLIFFDRVDEKSSYTNVIIDNYKCGFQATEHLIQQGCKDIVLLTSTFKRNVYAQRHAGYKKALSKNKIPYNKRLVLIKDLSESSAIEAAKEILQMNPLPDGLFITNDYFASVCMKYLMKHGINIPKDIAVVGFNNDAICTIVEPQLSTINYPGFELGEMAANQLLNQIQNKTKIKKGMNIFVHTSLIIRSSSLKMLNMNDV